MSDPVINDQFDQIMLRIANIQITVEVPGVSRPNILAAEPYQPSDTNSIKMPFVINEAHGGPADIPISSGQQYVTTDIWMMFCLKRKEGMTNLKLGARETIMWRNAVLSTFAKRVKLSDPAMDDVPGQAHYGLPFVLDAHITSWEAPVNYVYAANEYLAIKFILRVNEFYITEIDK